MLEASSLELSQALFHKCVEYLIDGNYHLIGIDPEIKRMTQRLYGDYRQIKNTQEYKRAEKHVKHFKSTGLGRELF